jgi:hypothetical protein
MKDREDPKDPYLQSVKQQYFEYFIAYRPIQHFYGECDQGDPRCLLPADFGIDGITCKPQHSPSFASQHKPPTRSNKTSKMPRSRSNPLVEAIRRRQPFHVVRQIVRADPESVRRPVDAEEDDNWYPLHEAVVAGASEHVVGLLVDEHPEALREKDKRGWLPLHLAVQPRWRPWRPAYEPDEALEVIRSLCRGWPGAKPELTNGGRDPFQIAAHFENWEAMPVLSETRYGVAFGPPDPRRRAVPSESNYDVLLGRGPPPPSCNGNVLYMRAVNEAWRGSRSSGRTASAGASPSTLFEDFDILTLQRAHQQQQQQQRRAQQRQLPPAKLPLFRRNAPRPAAPRGPRSSSNHNKSSSTPRGHDNNKTSTGGRSTTHRQQSRQQRR